MSPAPAELCREGQKGRALTAAERVGAARALLEHQQARPHLHHYLPATRRMLARFEAQESAS